MESRSIPPLILGRVFKPGGVLITHKAIFRLAFCILLVATAQGQNRPEEQLARRILATVETKAKSAGPDVRAFVWMQLATALEDKPKQRKLLQAAYLETLEIPVLLFDTRWDLQWQILSRMEEEAGPEALEEVLPRAEGYSRSSIYELLIDRYAEDGKIDRALELLQTAPDHGEYPFFAAKFLMGRLPPARVGLRRTIFDRALGMARGDDDFEPVVPMLIEFWRDLPTGQVLQAIDAMLREARQEDACPKLRKRALGSAYFYYVNQLLPVLRELDPAQAERLEQERASDVLLPEKCDYSARSGAPSNSTSTPAPTPTPEPAEPHPQPPERLVFGCPIHDNCRDEKIEHLLRTINLDLKWNAIEYAKRDIETGFAMAEEEWQYDTDPDGHNHSLTYRWDSTLNWEAFTILASYVSPSYALEKTNQIPDLDIRLITRETLARYWLGKEITLRLTDGKYIPRHWREQMP